MERKIIFATGNENKMKEIRMILADLGMPILSMKEAGISVDVVEDETTTEDIDPAQEIKTVKERLSAKHYLSVGITLLGIILIGIVTGG